MQTRCFESGEHSDITITVAGETFHAHMLVLASASPFFAKIRKDTYVSTPCPARE